MSDNYKPISIKEKFSLVNSLFSPKTIATLNDYEIKVVKSEGEFTWHKHDDTDELFWLISGKLMIKFRDGEVILNPNEIFVVPKGVEHTTIALEPCQTVLIEPTGTRNTGDVENHLTAKEDFI